MVAKYLNADIKFSNSKTRDNTLKTEAKNMARDGSNFIKEY